MEDGPARGGPVTRRRALALGAGGAAVLLGGAAGLLGARSGDGGGASGTRPAEAVRAFDPAGAAALFANRARAVRSGDEAAFLATAASAPAAFRDVQARMYGNLGRLPLKSWEERVVAPHAVDDE